MQTQPWRPGEAAGEGKHLVHRHGHSLIPSRCHQRVPRPLPVLPAEPAGRGPVRTAGWEQDWDWDGDGGGSDMHPAGGVPSDAAGIPCCNSTFLGKEGPGQRRRGLVPRLNIIHPSTVSQVAFRIRKSKKYIHRCSLVYLLTLCNLFALICFCLSWDFPF